MWVLVQLSLCSGRVWFGWTVSQSCGFSRPSRHIVVRSVQAKCCLDIPAPSGYFQGFEYAGGTGRFGMVSGGKRRLVRVLPGWEFGAGFWSIWGFVLPPVLVVGVLLTSGGGRCLWKSVVGVVARYLGVLVGVGLPKKLGLVTTGASRN